MVFLAQRVVIWPCDWLNYFSHRHDSFSLYYVIISKAANTTKNLNKNLNYSKFPPCLFLLFLGLARKLTFSRG